MVRFFRESEIEAGLQQHSEGAHDRVPPNIKRTAARNMIVPPPRFLSFPLRVMVRTARAIIPLRRSPANLRHTLWRELLGRKMLRCNLTAIV